MSKLIALVATAVFVNGERTVIQPGEPLPDLSDHDSDALTKSGAASDVVADQAAAKQQKKEDAAAGAEFLAEREAIKAAQASTVVEGAAKTPAAKTMAAKRSAN